MRKTDACARGKSVSHGESEVNRGMHHVLAGVSGKGMKDYRECAFEVMLMILERLEIS